MKRFLCALAALVASACSTDTAPGLVVVIDSATVHQEPSSVASASLNVTYRVGDHAPAAHTFRPNLIGLYSDGALVSSMAVQTPSGFRNQLSPGQSAQATLTGTGPGDGMQHCGQEVQILLRWMGAAPTEIGMTMANATVMCP